MESQQDFMKSPEMIQMLEQLRQDINADIERRKYAYIGKDGHDYYDKESLDAANKAYIERMYTYIGKDGRNYSTTKELEIANSRYEDMMNPKIDIYKEPLRREDMMNPKIDISNQFGYEDSGITHKRR